MLHRPTIFMGLREKTHWQKQSKIKLTYDIISVIGEIQLQQF